LLCSIFLTISSKGLLCNLQVGICKIILPKGWQPCKSAHPELREFTLKRPIEQTLTGKQGFYQVAISPI